MSVTVCRRVRGFCKGSKKGVGVLREGVVGVGGLRFKDRLKVGVLYRSVFISITSSKLY